MHAGPIAIPITTFTIASSQHVSITRITQGQRGRVFFVQITTTKSILFFSPPRALPHNGALSHSLDYCVLITVIIAVTWQIYPALAQALHQLPQVTAEAAPGRCQEMQESLWDGAQGALVHAVQVEESVHKIRRRCLISSSTT